MGDEWVEKGGYYMVDFVFLWIFLMLVGVEGLGFGESYYLYYLDFGNILLNMRLKRYKVIFIKVIWLFCFW